MSQNAKLDREFWLLAIAVALVAVASQGMTQLLKVLYVLRLGFGPEFVGIMFAIGSGCFALSSVPAGALGSRFGTRTVMIAGVGITILSTIALASSAWLPPELRLAGPLAFEVLSPVGWCFIIVNQVAALSAVTTTANRKRAFGIKEGILGIGAFAGALLAGFLPGFYAGLAGVTTAQPEPYGLAVLTSTLFALVALVPLLMVRPAPAVARPALSRSSLPPLPLLALIALSAYFNTASFASARVFAAAYLDTIFFLSTALIGVITSAGTLMAIAGTFNSHRLTRRRGAAFGMIVTTLLTTTGLAVMAVAPQWAGVAIGLIAVIGFAAMWIPSYQVVQMELVNEEWRGLVAGAGQMAMSLGFASMSLAGGRIVVSTGYPSLYAIAAILGVASAVLMAMAVRALARHAATAAAPAAEHPGAPG